MWINAIFKKEPEEEYNSWMCFTDLISGFLVVFIIVSIVFYKKYTDLVVHSKKKIEDSSLKNMINEYRDVFQIYDGIDVYPKFDEVRGSIALRHMGKEKEDKALLFVEGRSEVQGDLEKYLEQIRGPLIQTTMRLWEKYGDENIELRIEGHTNPNPRNDENSFIENLELSSDRANNVYKFFFNHSSDEEQLFIKKNMISVGYSYSRRINEENEWDESLDEQSKTIEFRVITK